MENKIFNVKFKKKTEKIYDYLAESSMVPIR